MKRKISLFLAVFCIVIGASAVVNRAESSINTQSVMKNVNDDSDSLDPNDCSRGIDEANQETCDPLN